MTPTCGTTPVAISNYLRQQATAPLDRIYYLDRWMESIKSSSHPPTQPSRSLLPHGNGEKEKIPPPHEAQAETERQKTSKRTEWKRLHRRDCPCWLDHSRQRYTSHVPSPLISCWIFLFPRQLSSAINPPNDHLHIHMCFLPSTAQHPARLGERKQRRAGWDGITLPRSSELQLN